MGLTQGAGGDDRLQVGIAVMCVVVSLVVTAMVPMLVPEYDADADPLAEARAKMENFTGESMVGRSPWQLVDVRTPYTANEQTNVLSEYGWVYGSISTTYTLNGTSYIGEEVVRLDPSKKSNMKLVQSEDEASALGETEIWWFWDNWLGDANYWLASNIGGLFGIDVERTEPAIVSGSAFNFTGQMYHFYPTYRISTQGSSATTLNSDMASLNIVWYDNGNDSGISGGLVLQSNKSSAIIADFAAVDIIADLNESSDYATRYLLNFEDIQVYMYIMFDTAVLTSGYSLIDAWNQGYWTIAFASPSADGLMDIFNSNDLSASIGNLLDTYLSIFTFNMPNCPAAWNIVFLLVCVLPLEIAVIMFLSRFGIAGLGAGLLGNALAFLGGVA